AVAAAARPAGRSRRIRDAAAGGRTGPSGARLRYACADRCRSDGGRITPAEANMRLGMIGLGRMGSNMVRRLLAAGHECVVFDPDAAAVQRLAAEGAIRATSASGLLDQL